MKFLFANMKSSLQQIVILLDQNLMEQMEHLFYTEKLLLKEKQVYNKISRDKRQANKYVNNTGYRSLF